MANIEITTNDTRGIVLFDPLYAAETLTALGATTWPAGTVLGRITATSKLAPYDSGAATGVEVPKFVLTQEVVFDAAGDKTCNVLMSGQVYGDKLIEFGVGILTPAQLDELRDFTIIGRSSVELGQLDNV